MVEQKKVILKVLIDPDKDIYYEKTSLLYFLSQDQIYYLQNGKLEIADYIENLTKRIADSYNIERS